MVLGTICLRFPQLAEALLGLMQPSQGTLLRVVGVFSNEARDAAIVIIPATLAITVLAGRRRDANLDLELGAACFIPFFVARAIERVAFALIAHPGRAGSSSGLAYAPAVAWAAWVLIQALRVTWSRPLPGATPAVESVSAEAAPAEARAQVDPAVSVAAPPLAPPPELGAAAAEFVPPVTTAAAGGAAQAVAPAPRARTAGLPRWRC